MSLGSRGLRIVSLLAALALLVGLGWWWTSRGSAEPRASSASEKEKDEGELTSPRAAPPATSPSDRRPARAASPGGPRPIRPLEGRASSDDALRTGILAGVVLSTRTRAPVPGAELLFDHLGTLQAVTTSADGSFRFLPASEGLYLLTRIAAQGFFPFAPDWGQRSPGRT